MSLQLALMPSVAAKSYDAFAIANGHGTVYALLPNAQLVTWQTSFGSAPAAISITIDTSIDNVAWNVTATTTAVGGAIDSFVTSAQFIRASIVSHTNGDTVTVNLIAKNATLASAQDITGSISEGQVAFGATDNEITGDDSLIWDKTTDTLQVAGPTIATSGSRGWLITSSGSGYTAYQVDGTSPGDAIEWYLRNHGDADSLTNLELDVIHSGNTEKLLLQVTGFGDPAAKIQYSGTVSGDLRIINSLGDVRLAPSANVRMSADVQIDNGKSLKTDTTTAHTALLQAYDVDGATYSTFVTLTNGNTPDMTIAPPAGGTVTLQGSTFKSSDGSAGATTTITTASLVGKTITVKNGLITDFA